ncbi:MAG: type II toxin-antitoxin system RelE/ParE family toxin [Deltaproteobacteria bacterium]|nr:type II toxin-antitoxin system RelE/ParE family toxin [Deltaproteobacteria bacterium]
MSYRIDFTASAAREFERLTHAVRDRVSRKIAVLRENPFPAGILKLSSGYEGHRLRVGDWRILYTVEASDQVITVYAVRHRREAYR